MRSTSGAASSRLASSRWDGVGAGLVLLAPVQQHDHEAGAGPPGGPGVLDDPAGSIRLTSHGWPDGSRPLFRP